MRRFLHSIPEAPQLAGRNIVQAAPTVDGRALQVPKFSVLGLGSLLQVQLPASVELIAKRNTLSGILGADAPAASLSSRLRLASSPILSAWAGQPLLQQKIIGVSPLTCLISSTKNEFLSTLELDGTLDWVLKAPVQAFAGRQLYITPKSGWTPNSAAPFAHSIVSGRGWLCFGSPSSTVQIQLPEGESVLVAKPHLIAYSVDTNARSNAPTIKDIKHSFGTIERTNDDLALPTDPEAVEATTTGFTGALARYWSQLKKAVHSASVYIERYTRSGNSSAFIEIHGPSTVIVSSSAARAVPAKEKE